MRYLLLLLSFAVTAVIVGVAESFVSAQRDCGHAALITAFHSLIYWVNQFVANFLYATKECQLCHWFRALLLFLIPLRLFLFGQRHPWQLLSHVSAWVIVESCEPDSARPWPVKHWLALQADLLLVIGQHCQPIKYVCMSWSAVLWRAKALSLRPPASRSVVGLEEGVAWVFRGSFTKEILFGFGVERSVEIF